MVSSESFYYSDYIATHGENCWKLLDVEPFHGFVVSDYIALFCVNL